MHRSSRSAWRSGSSARWTRTRRTGDSGVIVPNQYDLHLHPSDFAAFASYRSSLEDDLAHGVLARARHERYTLVARPRVEIISDEETRRGEIRVAANVVDERGERVAEAMPMPANSDTMVFNAPGRGQRTGLRAAGLPARQHPRQPTGAVRPRRAAHRHRASKRQRRDRRRPDGQPPPLPAQAAARRVRLHRPRQPERLDRQRAAGQPDRARPGRRHPRSATPRSSSRSAHDRRDPARPAPRAPARVRRPALPGPDALRRLAAARPAQRRGGADHLALGDRPALRPRVAGRRAAVGHARSPSDRSTRSAAT